MATDERNERRKRWWAEHGAGREALPSMKRRKPGHDYRSRGLYMITLVVEGRLPLLGTLHGAGAGHDKPWVEASALGERVARA